MASRCAPGLSSGAMSAPLGTLKHQGACMSPFRNSAPSRRMVRSTSDKTSMVTSRASEGGVSVNKSGEAGNAKLLRVGTIGLGRL